VKKIMALIHCPDCGMPVSSEAPYCLNCGAPILVKQLALMQAIEEAEKQEKRKKIIGKVKDSLAQVLIALVLIVFIIIFMIVLIWFVKIFLYK
jgi:uncharacterized membrane protein YvbJ